MAKFEVYKDKKGETRFRYRASNGEIIFSSEGYKAKASALRSIESLKKHVGPETVEEIPPAPRKSVPPAPTGGGVGARVAQPHQRKDLLGR